MVFSHEARPRASGKSPSPSDHPPNRPQRPLGRVEPHGRGLFMAVADGASMGLYADAAAEALFRVGVAS
jgi:hypothetical protein